MPRLTFIEYTEEEARALSKAHSKQGPHACAGAGGEIGVYNEGSIG